MVENEYAICSAIQDPGVRVAILPFPPCKLAAAADATRLDHDDEWQAFYGYTSFHKLRTRKFGVLSVAV